MEMLSKYLFSNEKNIQYIYSNRVEDSKKSNLKQNKQIQTNTFHGNMSKDS